MSIIKNVSSTMQKHRESKNMSLSELAEEIGIPISSVQCYLKGTADLRATTIELLAEKMNIPLIEMISGPTPEWERAENVFRAAREFSDLPKEKQEQGVQLFYQLVTLFTEEDEARQ